MLFFGPQLWGWSNILPLPQLKAGHGHTSCHYTANEHDVFHDGFVYFLICGTALMIGYGTNSNIIVTCKSRGRRSGMVDNDPTNKKKKQKNK